MYMLINCRGFQGIFWGLEGYDTPKLSVHPNLPPCDSTAAPHSRLNLPYLGYYVKDYILLLKIISFSGFTL